MLRYRTDDIRHQADRYPTIRAPISVKGLGDVSDVVKDLLCDVSFQAEDDLSFTFAFSGAAGDVSACSFVVGHANHDDSPDCLVALTVGTGVEAFTFDES